MSGRTIVPKIWPVSTLNAKILVQERVVSMLNVQWTGIILFAVVLQDLWEILSIDVFWTKDPHPSLILAILRLVDQTPSVPSWMEVRSVSA